VAATEPETPPASLVLQLTELDNVAVATVTLSVGRSVALRGGDRLQAIEEIPAGHKISVTEIPAGSPVIKYGVNIGTATRDIPAGSHVHVHNLESERMRGDRG
jgi:altronate dehydratase